jgi:hypothetical protein
MIPTIIGSVVGIMVCLSLYYITRWISDSVDASDRDAQ